MFYIDIVSSIFLVSFSVLGLIRGFFKDLFSILSWVLSLLVSWYFSPQLLIYLSDFISNAQALKIISFVSVFLLSFVLIRAIGNLLSSFVSAIGLGIFDRLLGIIFGTLKSIAIMTLIIFLVEPFIFQEIWWADSYTDAYYSYVKSFLDSNLEDWDKYLDLIPNKEDDQSPSSV